MQVTNSIYVISCYGSDKRKLNRSIQSSKTFKEANTFIEITFVKKGLVN